MKILCRAGVPPSHDAWLQGQQNRFLCHGLGCVGVGVKSKNDLEAWFMFVLIRVTPRIENLGCGRGTGLHSDAAAAISPRCCTQPTLVTAMRALQAKDGCRTQFSQNQRVAFV